MVKKGGLAGNGARGQRRVNDRRHEPSQCPQVLKRLGTCVGDYDIGVGIGEGGVWVCGGGGDGNLIPILVLFRLVRNRHRSKPSESQRHYRQRPLSLLSDLTILHLNNNRFSGQIPD
ncbi:hypothetical protein Bca4012_046587 [Brassica carinata]